MKQDSNLSVRALLLGSLGAFGVLAVVSALITPAIVDRFYPLLPDRGADWYYWQLPHSQVANRITYWVGYGLHQIVLWALLFKAREVNAVGNKVTRFNIIVLGINVLFVALHLAQTYFWYDGLAQDVPIWTSQGSVIVMLVLILFMEIPHRGLIWGKRFPVPATTYEFVRKWHGFYISWAVVYTFWFHPMDSNWGLLSGFVYMFLLFIQLSLFNTKIHMNRKWLVLLEFGVTVHATIITIYKENPIWPMFMVGFLVMLVLTQMHEFRMPTWAKWTILVAFLLGVGALYVFVRGIEQIYEITFIPVALYGGALALLGLGLIVERIRR